MEGASASLAFQSSARNEAVKKMAAKKAVNFEVIGGMIVKNLGVPSTIRGQTHQPSNLNKRGSTLSRIAAQQRFIQSSGMWITVREFQDIRYEMTNEGDIAKSGS